MGETINQITIGELIAILIGLGAIYAFAKNFIAPVVNKWLNTNTLDGLKDLPERVAKLEQREKEHYKMIEDNDTLNRLLCKAMIALIDNRITDNNFDNLKTVKAEMLDYITKR